VVLEAMSLGLPVVATAVGGTSEVYEWENGLLIPPMADELLSQTLLHLVTFPEERQRMASRARHSNGAVLSDGND